MQSQKIQWPYRKIVEVEWEDAVSKTSWHLSDHSDYHGNACKTVGFLVKNTKREIVIAQNISVNECEDVSDVMVIPRGILRRIRTIGRGK